MQFDARRATTSGATKPHHTQPRRTDGRTKRGCNRRGDARRSGRERGGPTVCLLSKQRAAAAGGERGTEQMEVETDKELGLVFRGWGTGTGQAQGERHNLDGRWSCPGGLYASPLLSLIPHRLDSGRLVSVHVHIAACQSKVGQQIDVSFFFFLEKNETWMTIGAALSWWALSARASGLSVSTIHGHRTCPEPGTGSRRGTFPCLQKCLPGPSLDFHRVLRRVLFLPGLNLPKAMQEGSGVGRYSLTDCALLARLKKQPRSAAVHQPRRRNRPHEPRPLTCRIHLGQDGERGRGRQQGSRLEARGSRSTPSSADGRRDAFPATHSISPRRNGARWKGAGGDGAVIPGPLIALANQNWETGHRRRHKMLRQFPKGWRA